MAWLPYADEDFDRRLGCDVLTAHEAGKSNQGVGDPEVLSFASGLGRAVLTFNRRDFIRLHRLDPEHAGIIVCTRDVDFSALAGRIFEALSATTDLKGRLIRVHRP